MSDSSSGSSWLERLGRVFSDAMESREDLVQVLKQAHEQEVIDTESLLMIEGVLEVSESRVRDIMLPRPQIVLIDLGDTLEEILDTMLDSSHSRYPLLNEGKILGVILAKDVFRALVKGELNELADFEKLLRSPNFVPESKRLNVLLREFKESRNHMALVVDEYAELSGIVTIEDVLEQIVGSIEDEFDEEEAPIRKRSSNLFLVDAITNIEDFNKFFNTSVDEEVTETIGGFVAHELGHVPMVDEVIMIDDYQLRVSKASERRVQEFEVRNVAIDKASSNSDSTQVVGAV